jgi:hypothetical protein
MGHARLAEPVHVNTRRRPSKHVGGPLNCRKGAKRCPSGLEKNISREMEQVEWPVASCAARLRRLDEKADLHGGTRTVSLRDVCTPHPGYWPRCESVCGNQSNFMEALGP